jgi:TolB protein
MAVIAPPNLAPPIRAAWLTVLTLLALTLALGTAIIGASLFAPDSHATSPLMSGEAANGLIAHDGGGDIWLIEPDGSDERRVTSGPELDILPSWSPDGTKLAHWSISNPARTSTSVNDAEYVNGGTATLAVIDLASDERVEIATDLKVDWDFGTAVTWSPDSSSLAFSHLAGKTPLIDIVALADPSLQPVRLVDGWSPSWSPDGRLIAYRGPVGRPGVWVIAPDGSDTTCHKSCGAWAGRKVTRVTGSGYAFTYPQWSADGSLLTFYAGPDGYHDVWVARSDGSDEWAVGDELVEEYWPSFSPDGSRVAFGRNVGPGCCEFEFVLSDPDGSQQVTLAAGPFGPSAPNNWSPDGRFLLGERGGEDGSAVLELVEVGGSADRENVQIPIRGDWASPAWQRVSATGLVDA